MNRETNHHDRKGTQTVAAVDIGSNLIRLVVAEVLPDGHVHEVERLQRPVRLGQDTFRRGQLSAKSIRESVSVLRDFCEILDLYGVGRLRAVATSAVREASNADTFLDRVYMATGITVEVLDTSEESRLTVEALHDILGGELSAAEEQTLLAAVGGGSTQLTVLDRHGIVRSHSLKLGAIRLQELWTTGKETPERAADLLRRHIVLSVRVLKSIFPLDDVKHFIAMGGDVRLAAREIGEPIGSSDLIAVDAERFNAFVRKCVKLPVEGLTKTFGLPYTDAETLNPALLVYQALLRSTQADQLLVSNISMRSGLLVEVARQVTGHEDPAITEGIIQSAQALLEKYHGDSQHAQSTAAFALILFDEMQSELRLKPRHRVLLHVAALLHDIGGFVSSQAHHKHSFYLISNSEIFGLSCEEITLVALVARYHRRSNPKASHTPYASQPRQTRIIVNKLAAILRVADALGRGRTLTEKDVRFERQDDALIIRVRDRANFLLEERAVGVKGNLFEDIFGMTIRLEEF